jgi:glycine betaine/proline transport system ATP-binding protein
MRKIEVRHLTKIFGPRPHDAAHWLANGASPEDIRDTGNTIGLNDVSFDVADGEIVVVMGLSGSGKSTLIRCINRLIEPTSGTVIVDGRDVTSLDEAALLAFRREKFGMVFQQFALLPHRTVLANVEYGLEIQDRPGQERGERAREAIRLVGLEGWEEAYPNQLSGGMQQRVGLARALAIDPEILLMDEAFSALDPLIRRDMQEELVSLQKRMRKTILFVSHDLDEAIKIGDRIVLLRDGAVAQIGTPEEILTNPATRYVERFVEDIDVSKVLTAASVMSDAGAVAHPADGPRTALRKMQQENYSSLMVVERDGRFCGMVSVEDVEQALAGTHHDLRELVHADVPRAAPDTPLTQLFSMLSNRHEALPVIGDDERLLGVVVKAGVLRALAEGGGDTAQEAPDA